MSKPFRVRLPPCRWRSGSCHVIWCLVLILAGNAGAEQSSPWNRDYTPHGNAWKEFATIYRAARDLGGPDQFKIRTISPVILKSIFERIGALLPSTRIYKAGCVTAADQFVGPAASQTRRTPQDLLLPPRHGPRPRRTTRGVCGAHSRRFPNEMVASYESQQ